MYHTEIAVAVLLKMIFRVFSFSWCLVRDELFVGLDEYIVVTTSQSMREDWV